MAPHDIHFPPSQGYSVKVCVINGARTHWATEILVDRVKQGQDFMDLACYSFLIESEHHGKKVLFDLAFMKNADERMPPSVKAGYDRVGDRMGVKEIVDVPDTLQVHGLHLSAINAIIWSHAHADHMGDPSAFPNSTDLVVGPGTKDRYLPGYPTALQSCVLDSAFQGRSVRELDFASSTTSIGGFRALDFFDDSSFWLLDAPGHTDHHVCALARTTEDTWLFMAGDACHNIAQLRPNPWRPLPDNVPADILGRNPPPAHRSCSHMSCLLQSDHESAFYGLAPHVHEDIIKAEKTVQRLKSFEGRDDVMVMIAHDATLSDVIDFFPREVTDWKAKGWADESRWRFLKDLENAARWAAQAKNHTSEL